MSSSEFPGAYEAPSSFSAHHLSAQTRADLQLIVEKPDTPESQEALLRVLCDDAVSTTFHLKDPHLETAARLLEQYPDEHGLHADLGAFHDVTIVAAARVLAKKLLSRPRA